MGLLGWGFDKAKDLLDGLKSIPGKIAEWITGEKKSLVESAQDKEESGLSENGQTQSAVEGVVNSESNRENLTILEQLISIIASVFLSYNKEDTEKLEAYMKEHAEEVEEYYQAKLDNGLSVEEAKEVTTREFHQRMYGETFEQSNLETDNQEQETETCNHTSMNSYKTGIGEMRTQHENNTSVDKHEKLITNKEMEIC